ncbi:MAG: hypothetical protein ABSD99_08305 [Candidatus Bathyarchaeia archaeon]|jgi:hypothetical protein
MKHLPKEIMDCGRGRPRGERPSLAEIATCWYLIWISKKYGLETRKFFTLFLDAWTRGKSSCKNVSIECRQKTETDGVFLVTQDQDVVAQVRMSEMALNRLSNIDLASFPWSEITFVEKVEKYGVADLQIKDVDVSTKWVNLKAGSLRNRSPGQSTQGLAVLTLYQRQQFLMTRVLYSCHFGMLK